MARGNVLKATIWYALSNFILKGLGLLTTPIFVRILTKAEYGTYTNLITWYSVISIIASLSLSSSLVRARFDFEKDLNSFVKSNLLLGSVSTIVISLVLILNKDFFCSLFVFDERYLYIICANVLVAPAYDILLMIQRFRYKYKFVAVLSVTVSLLSIGLSLLLIRFMSDNLMARTLGTYLPTFAVSAAAYLYFFINPGRIEWRYCKYALLIALPFIFHLLSGTVLNSSDKFVITKLSGPEENAMYSLAYSVGLIVNVVWNSMNSAFSPWLGEQLNAKAYGIIKRYTYPYVLLFAFGVTVLMLFAPEAMLVLGGKEYYTARYCVPPIMGGYFFLFAYSMYVNVEQFEKKTVPMAITTCLAAGINVITNVIFVRLYGYIAAAYTTLACYLLLFVFHFALVKHMGLHRIYDTKFIFIVSAIIVAINVLCVLVLYKHQNIRYTCSLLFIVAGLIVTWKNKDSVKSVLSKKKKE